MKAFPNKLLKKLAERNQQNALRTLPCIQNIIDFSSNDYLGFAKAYKLYQSSLHKLKHSNIQTNGATGSRLLTGNFDLYKELEDELCNFHNVEAALVFNTGYNANLGFFSTIPQKGDIVLYDAYVHASIRDGISLGNAQAYKFKHNDLIHLSTLLERYKDQPNTELYVVTESVFSMDGDMPNLREMITLTTNYNANLVVDEAHALGVVGDKGAGLVQKLGLETSVFARIVTFGKALGCHGAAILGNKLLKQYLINFARSLIYTTALPPHSLSAVYVSYQALQNREKTSFFSKQKEQLTRNILHFKKNLKELQETHSLKVSQTGFRYIESTSSIQCCIIPSISGVKKTAQHLKGKGYNVMPIVSPTVPKGEERLRFCIHSFNTFEEISESLKTLFDSLSI